MSPADSDDQLLQQARGRTRSLLDAVGGDLDALRDAASDAAYADGAAVCEEVAEAVRQLMAQLDVDVEGGSQSGNSYS